MTARFVSKNRIMRIDMLLKKLLRSIVGLYWIISRVVLTLS
jgi:hypothetical protein